MSQPERAASEVAKHFYKKYGHDEAIQIISTCIESDGAQKDTDFWSEVISVIERINAGSIKTTDMASSYSQNETLADYMIKS